ncbi:FAD-dependent monooxygenase [Actinacidiphila paucisporea]|uniref:Bifunctional hydroxylase/dehydrase n=1 Tax=Actinacidiphila paucisporea TaxID=310782 RepID=A0A1M7QYW3_9ACTN|nr:FAD-dependent monooxygenase [Actinacidiphila paucisporea]SHN37161.1 bifunctional hydroxylase/dehydrase [Actinacidiphila paucisporea]
MNTDVIVVGAGPAGMMLAGELRLAGVEVTVLEKLAAPTGESRGLGFTARTMEVFDQRGLLPRLPPFEVSNVGHFGGLPLDFGMLEGAHFAGKTLPQSQTEAMLAGWTADIGVDFRRGYECVGVLADQDGVTAQIGGPGGFEELRAKYLVGCDGGRSMIRKAMGFDFPGTGASMEMFLADLRGTNVRPRMIGESYPGGMVMATPPTDGVQRFIVCERGTAPRRRTTPIEFAEISDAWKRLTGEDISHGEPVWLSSFGNATRQATQYRRGRVLLAGDAAHIHLPAGGLGMNTSIQDAVNLGWKLAAQVHGWAPEGLLDTYHAERHAIGRRLLMNTQAQGLLFLSGDEVQPMRDLFTELLGYDVVAKHLIGMVSGLEIRYDVGAGDSPVLGKRMPNRELALPSGTRRVYELLRTARGLLLDLADDQGLREAAAPWADRVDVVTAPLTGLAADDPLASARAVLVRPDGYIAFIDPGTAAGLDEALRAWFGAPREAAAVRP